MTITDVEAHARDYLTTFWNNWKGPGHILRNPKYYDLSVESSYVFHYDAADLPTAWDTIDTVYFNNGTDSVQSLVLSRSETVTNSFSWSNETGFSLGIDVSMSMRVPFVGGIDTTVSTAFSFSSTETRTEETQRTWSVNQTINVNPHTALTGTIMLKKTTPVVPFTCTAFLSGTIYFELYHSSNPDKFLGYSGAPIGQPFIDRPLPNFFPETPYLLRFETKGIFTAAEGIAVYIDLLSNPLIHVLGDVSHAVKPFSLVLIPR